MVTTSLPFSDFVLVRQTTEAEISIHQFVKLSRCIKTSFYIPESRLNFSTTKGFKMNISMKLVYQYMTIFFTFSPTSNHLHPLQVENCDINLRFVVNEDDNVKSGLKRLN